MHQQRAGILSIGDELVLGQTLDTNSQWIAKRLVERGITPVEHVTVADDLEAHVRELRELAMRVDVIVCTGGLGPTADDLTREALASAMDDTLIEDQEALGWVEAWFARTGRTANALNRQQARRPSRGHLIPNHHGTAPGLLGVVAGGPSEDGSGTRQVDVWCLPGPPRELHPMFETSVAPKLRPRPRVVVRTRVLPTIGLGESEVAERLGELMERGRDPLVGTTASKGVVSVRIRSEQVEEAPIAEVEQLVRARLGPVVFVNGDVPLATEVVSLLKSRGLKLVTAESCTGGMLGGMVTDVAGSSAAFHGGWVTYSNERKQMDLGVPAAMFAATGPGAVSRECAEAMAQGALERAGDGADAALAITGIAGPDGGTAEKPVGTVWIACAMRRAVSGAMEPASASIAIDVRRYLFPGDRATVREWACTAALTMLRLKLIGVEQRKLLRQVE